MYIIIYILWYVSSMCVPDNLCEFFCAGASASFPRSQVFSWWLSLHRVIICLCSVFCFLSPRSGFVTYCMSVPDRMIFGNDCDRGADVDVIYRLLCLLVASVLLVASPLVIWCRNVVPCPALSLAVLWWCPGPVCAGLVWCPCHVFPLLHHSEAYVLCYYSCMLLQSNCC